MLTTDIFLHQEYRYICARQLVTSLVKVMRNVQNSRQDQVRARERRFIVSDPRAGYSAG